MGNLADVDPVGIARPWLLAQDDVTTELGGPDRVGPYNEPPYPRVVLTDPPGDDRDLTHLIGPLLQVEVYGDPDGTPGKPVLRRCMYTVLQALARIPEQQTEPGEPVITAVRSTGGGGWSPIRVAGGDQPRYIATVRLFGHPATTPKVTQAPMRH